MESSQETISGDCIRTIYSRLVEGRETLFINSQGYTFNSSIPGEASFESYFDPRISFAVSDIEPIQMIGQIQAAKKAQMKIENWGAEEVKNRLEMIRDSILKNEVEIASVEAHFQGSTKKFQINWCQRAVLEQIQQMVSQVNKVELCTPKGLIGAITPKSDAFYEIGLRILNSLFHRNALIVKPASAAAISAVLWAEILKTCDLPEGLISFCYGRGNTVGRFLMEHPGMKNLSFSGSFETLKKYSLTLEKKYQFFFNGKNSVCVLADFDYRANMDSVLRMFIEQNGKSVFSPARIFVLDTIEKDFKVALTENLSRVPKLNTIEDDFGFRPLVQSERERLKELKIQFESEEAKLIFSNENFLFFSDLANCSELHQENLELPIYNLTSVKYSHEMIRWINNTSFGHSLFIFGSKEKAQKIVQKSEVGRVFMNSSLTTYDNVVSVKNSSFGEISFDLPSPFYSYNKI